MADLRASVKKDEIELFEELADDWWNPEGRTLVLHRMVPTIRIPLVMDSFVKTGLIKAENVTSRMFFKALKF